jgi:long-chain fatty acid transport protein
MSEADATLTRGRATCSARFGRSGSAWPSKTPALATTVLFIGGTLFTTDIAHAGSGFLLRSQSTTTLGTAQAGMSTNTEDASGMVFNPALLGNLKGREIDVGGTPIFPRGHFEPTSASTVLGTPISGNDGGAPSNVGYPFNVYFATPLPNAFSAGIALTSLYGLGFEYDSGWVGRYHAGKSELLSLDIVPAVAYKSGPFSLGIGLDVKYARVKTTTAIDFGTVAFAASGGALGVPSGNDGALSTKLDGWRVGAIVGVTYEPAESGDTRLGISYRSKVKSVLTGDATFDTGGAVGQTVAALSGQFTDTSGRAPLTFPAAVTAGIDQKLSANWRLLADVQWTQWSSLKQLDLSFGNPLQQPIVTDLRWRNTWYLGAGLRYEYDKHWVLRLGIAYDQTPTRRKTSTPAIPDADSVWLTVGARYKFDEKTKLDFAYGHIFVRDNPIALQAGAPGNAARGNLNGTIRGSAVDFFSLQLSYKF